MCGLNGDFCENVVVVNVVEVREIRSLGFMGDLCSGWCNEEGDGVCWVIVL